MGFIVRTDAEVDLQRAYEKLSESKRRAFLRHNLRDLGGVKENVNKCFTKQEISDFVERRQISMKNNTSIDVFKKNAINHCYKLPEWKSLGNACNSITSTKEISLCTIEYDIDEHPYDFALFCHRIINEDIHCEKIGAYKTVDEAKAAAEKHYNNLIKDFLEALK